MFATQETSKNVGGRPQKDEDEKRTNRLTIHLSDDEKQRLELAARAAGLRLAAFVRTRTLEALKEEPSTV